SEGVATLSFNYKLTWQGPGDRGVVQGEPRITIDSDFQSTLHPDHEIDDEYNLAQLLLPRDRLINVYNRDTRSGTATIRLNRYNMEDLEMDDNFLNFLYALLLMEIDYSYENPYSTSSNLVRGRQKKCINLKVLIDDHFVSPFRIPSLLNRTKSFLEGTSEIIEPVLEYSTLARRYTTYGVMGTHVAYYISNVRSRISCASFLPTFIPRKDNKILLKSSDSINPAFTCEAFEDEDRKQNCNLCWDSILRTQRLNRVNRFLLDRIFCPSIPSVQEYNKRIQRRSNNYFMLKMPDDTEELGKFSNNLYIDNERNMMVSNINFCNNISAIFLSENEDDILKRDLCRLQYEYEWGSACLFARDLFNKSFQVNNLTGNTLQRISEVMEKFCFKSNTVSHDIIQINNRQQCINACHPDYTKKFNINNQGDHCERKSDEDLKDQMAFFGLPGRGLPCFYILNPVGHPPGIYYAEYDQSSVCQIDPNTNNCRTTSDGSVIIDPNELRVKLDPLIDDNLPGGGSVTDYIKEILKKKEITNVEAERVNIMQSFGLGYYAFSHNNKYVMEPSRTIASCITCVCITGFEQHLRLYKSFIDLGVTCMNEVMYDPNSTATSCQRIFASRLCDLLFEAIKCVGKYYSENVYFSNDRHEESGGIGRLFAAMDSAGSEVSHNLRDRYGSSTVFENVFSEKAILNAVCMAAFFGDFSAEFDTLFAATEDMVVTDPILMVYPSQREYMSYSPLNGLATFIYRFNIILIAGADLNYHVYLKCTTGMCGSEPCDCMHQGEVQEYKQTGIQGTLRRHETLHRDFIRQVTSDVRYDTVLVRYDYRNAHGEKVTGEKEFSIREIGGRPPAHCQFDILSLKFMCRIEIGERGFASFGSPAPRILGTTQHEASLRIGDLVIVDGEVLKRDKDNDIKNIFLAYRVRDDSGNERVQRSFRVLRDPGVHPLEQIFRNENLIRIQESWFGVVDEFVQTYGGLSIRMTGTLQNEARFRVSGSDHENLRMYITSDDKIYFGDGSTEIESGKPIENIRVDDSFIIMSGNNIVRFSVLALPRHTTYGEIETHVTFRGGSPTSRRFTLELSLHYESENDPELPDFSQPIYNDQGEERHTIDFTVLRESSTKDCDNFFRFNEIRANNHCYCESEDDPCRNPNLPDLKYCYGVCRQYPACNAARHFDNPEIFKDVSLIKVEQDRYCVCDPKKPPGETDYHGGNTESYCYNIKDGEDGYKTVLTTKTVLVNHLRDDNVCIFRNGRCVNQREMEVPSYGPNNFVQRANDELNKWGGGSLLDNQEGASEFLKNYWAAAGVNYDDFKTQPWSAAFISYITFRQLQSPMHSTYINQVYNRENNNWEFKSPDYLTSFSVGDIVCEPREDSNPTIEMIRNSESYKSHCDIVVEINENSIQVIGGNLGNSVKKITVNLKENGKLPDKYFAVLRRKPPLT
ncbi:MAG: DUF2272 domain-containing protein, partial [Candidatus Woesearchaeota archaeon]